MSENLRLGENNSELLEPHENASEQERKKTPESLYEEFVKKREAIQRDREITFNIAALQGEGLQTLVTNYGADRVFDIAEGEPKKEKSFSMSKVIRALEPNKEKRNELFKKMMTDAQEQVENRGEYFEIQWGSGGNFIRAVEHSVADLKSMDGMLGKFQIEISPFMNALAASAFQDREKKQEIIDQLSTAGNDIFRLVEDRDKNTTEQEAQLFSATGELHEKLTKEVERITQELETGHKEQFSPILADLANIESMETGSDGNKEILAKVLEETAKNIKAHRERTTEEIANKTDPLKKIISGLSSTNPAFLLRFGKEEK